MQKMHIKGMTIRSSTYCSSRTTVPCILKILFDFNPEKMNLLSFVLRLNVRKSPPIFLSVFLIDILHPVDSVKHLSVWFDAECSFSEHVKWTCKACFLHMCDLCRTRQYVAAEVAAIATNALVSSRLDYCISLFRGLSYFKQHKLQSVQNTLAHIVTNNRKYAHVTPILKHLHWYQCMFKTATLVYKFLHSGSPSYFERFLYLSSSSYSTRRSHPDHQYLTVPPFH